VRADVAKNKNTLHDYSFFMKKRLTTIINENYGTEFLEKTQEIKKVIDNYGVLVILFILVNASFR
jgi:hypothetical protein